MSHLANRVVGLPGSKTPQVVLSADERNELERQVCSHKTGQAPTTLVSFGLLAAGHHERWWPLVLSGIVGIGLGALTFIQPQLMALTLIYVIGVWAIITGALEIVAAIRLRKVITNEWLLSFGGALSIVFGVLVVAQPIVGAFAVVVLFGFYAILTGFAQIGVGLRLRSLHGDLPSVTQPAS
jgi:Short repeat of unknown function (DUF308)